MNDPANCGNIPIELLDYKNEQIRVSTFKNWPVSFISAAAVAKAGFYYINRLDQVKCAWCQGVIGQWEVGDDPFYEHRKYFGHCPKASESSTNNLTNNFEVGVQAVRNPKMLVYSNLDSRIRTFANKWNYAHIQDPKKIAEAGFYYQGNEDEVRCFYCDGGLRFWLKNDDPWSEHARWFPLCQFVQLVKGEGFIKNIQEEATRNINSNTAVQPSMAMTLDEALATEPVQMALQMGLNAGRVRAVTKKYLERTGRAMPSSEALVEAVLEGQINDEDSESSFSNNRSLENEVSRILWSALSSEPTLLSNSPPPTTSDMNQASSSTSFSPSSNSTATVTSAEITTHATETSDALVLSSDAKSVELALAEENKRLRDARECKICMAEEVGCVFIPCGHLGKFEIPYSVVCSYLNLLITFSVMCSMCASCTFMPTLPS